jgi:sorting nexin-9/18/33
LFSQLLKLIFIIENFKIDGHGEAQWHRKSEAYKIKITNFTSGNKYKGLKTYTAYTIQADIVGHSVNRRYKQFDWLHERLTDKYPNLCVPQLPDKAVTGRFEEEFIKKRQVQLELWLNRMSLHPVINQSEVFIHFLQCKESDEKKWKDGKRKAEKDEFRGAQWLCSIRSPDHSCGTTVKIKEQIDKFSKAAVSLDSTVKNLTQAIDKVAQTHATIYKKELGYMGKKFEEFGSAIANDALSSPKDPSHNKLCEALKHTGVTFVDIANCYGEQAKDDAIPLIDQLSLYRGILQQMPEIVNFDKVR